MPPQIKYLDSIRSQGVFGQQVAEALNSLGIQVGNISQKVNVDPAGQQIAAPPNIGSLSVLGANGVFDAAIVDAGTIQLGILYFLEYSLDINFTQPIVISLGPSRNWRGFLGNQTLFWRAYSQYTGSPTSSPVSFGTPPTPVVGGGAAGPTIQPSSGSGTCSTNGQQGGHGLGPVQIRTNMTAQ
jgi:hypothetical protein